MRRSQIFACAVCCLVSLLAVPVSAGWKAGVAKQVITPPQPTWMSGYASRNRPAEGTLHDLWAKSLVIQDPAGRKLVLVTLDLVGIGRDLSEEVCNRLQKEHNLQRSQIALCTSHTHTGPVVGRNLGTMYFLNAAQAQRVSDYADLLVDRISQSVGAAMKTLADSTLQFGMGEARFAVNRRNNREADVPRLRAAGQLKGPVNHSVPVLSVTNNAQQELTAIVFGYACHATVLSFYQWSGDWPGFAQIEIEKRHPAAVALFVAGCGADQNPLPRRSVELAAGYGKQMADAVANVLSGEMTVVDGNAASVYDEIPLKLGNLPTRAELEEQTESKNKYIASRARSLLQTWNQRGKLAQFYPHYPIQLWAIGAEARLTFLGGEVVVDYANRIRADFPNQKVWVAGYCNDVMAYIPSRRVLREGGYEGETSMIYYGLPTTWADSIEDNIVTTVGKQLKKLSTPPNQSAK